MKPFAATVLVLGMLVLIMTAVVEYEEQRARAAATQPFFFPGQLVQFIGQDPATDNMIIIRHGSYDHQLKKHTYYVRHYGDLLHVWEHELRSVGQAETPKVR